MRKIATILIMMILAAATASAEKEYDFKATNNDGATIYYKLDKSKDKVGVAKGDVKYFGVINIPERVTYKKKEYIVSEIGKEAFQYCSSLMSVTIPNSVTSIGAYAFKGCSSLTSVSIPNSVTSIGDGAFYDCSSLISVSIPNSVTSIGDVAFMKCKSLTSVAIPNSVTSIGKLPFDGCASLTSVSIPNSVTSIGEMAFSDCASLTSLAIPSSVTSIGEMAFYKCTQLVSVSIPNSVTRIGDYAFKYCPLRTVYIQKGTSNDSPIRKYFKNNGLTEIADNDPRWGDAIVPAFDPKAFPILAVESVTFSDNGDNAIEGNEICSISVKISNTGKGAARGCTLKAISNAPGISVSDVKLPDIAPGTTYTAKVSVKAGMSTVNGKAEFSVMVDEPNGLGTDPTLLAVDTRAFEAPKVVVSDYAVTGSNGAKLEKRVPFDLQVLVQNMAHGTAEDVTVDISVPNNVFLTEGNTSSKLGKMEGGKTSELNYQLLVNNNYAAATVPVKVTLREKHGKYAESRTIDLQLNQALAQNKIEVKSAAPRQRNDISQATIAGKTELAETDINIPKTLQRRDRTFAVVIGNENYKREIPVPFAVNDANVVGQYLSQAYGLPAENIRVATDATRNEIIDHLDWLSKVAAAFKGDCDIIVYYSGHGMPDEKTQGAMLIPVDGNSSNPSTCLPMDQVYSQLAAMNAKNVTVMLDACFSGAQRGDGMLMAARGVVIKPKHNAPSGNMIVLSASQGDETAFPYNEKSHGMFTYFMLKKMQDSQGKATLGELFDYVNEQVGKRSILVNNKSQTPAANVSPSLSSTWRGMRW